jgi:acetate kinase
MGYTPASGLIMSTRAGDVDPGALITLLDDKKLSGSDAQEYIQTEGGLYGLTGSADLRQVLLMADREDGTAQNALQLYVEGIQSAIASAIIHLQGIDALVLTATVSERNSEIRQKIIAGLAPVGLHISEMLNERVSSSARLISDPDTSVPIAVIPTNEMGEMARIIAGFN